MGFSASIAVGSAAAVPPALDRIQLEVRPKVCTLASDDKQCETSVHAEWKSSRDESLCLVILDRPGIERCWEHYSQGFFNIDLVFTDDLVFQLKDVGLQQVLASAALRVIRETVPYRHRRRQPWNVLD